MDEWNREEPDKWAYKYETVFGRDFNSTQRRLLAPEYGEQCALAPPEQPPDVYFGPRLGREKTALGLRLVAGSPLCTLYESHPLFATG